MTDRVCAVCKEAPCAAECGAVDYFVARPPPEDILRAAIEFARKTWRNDGAEGETVHLLADALEASDRRVRYLEAILNSPITSDFMKALEREIAHQQTRWAATDPSKDETQWFWTLGWLAGKATRTPAEDLDKKLHRIVATAALAANWFRAVKEGR